MRPSLAQPPRPVTISRRCAAGCHAHVPPTRATHTHTTSTRAHMVTSGEMCAHDDAYRPPLERASLRRATSASPLAPQQEPPPPPPASKAKRCSRGRQRVACALACSLLPAEHARRSRRLFAARLSPCSTASSALAACTALTRCAFFSRFAMFLPRFGLVSLCAPLLLLLAGRPLPLICWQ